MGENVETVIKKMDTIIMKTVMTGIENDKTENGKELAKIEKMGEKIETGIKKMDTMIMKTVIMGIEGQAGRSDIDWLELSEG